jgi:hypothetical protein
MLQKQQKENDTIAASLIGGVLMLHCQHPRGHDVASAALQTSEGHMLHIQQYLGRVKGGLFGW